MPLHYAELLQQLRVTGDRYEIAKLMVELVERAERSPHLQELLKKIKLNSPFDNFEYIKCLNKKGFWRRVSYTREHPSVAQAEFRLAASKINADLFGTEGIVERLDGTRIPLAVHLAGEKLRGRKFTSDEEKAQREKERAVERIAGSEA